LNSCTGHGQDDLSLTELNLLCGKEASKFAAFVPASFYLRLALKYLCKLGSNPWESHYALSLRVYREISNIELCLGNFESGAELGQKVIENAPTLDDKLPTYFSLAVAKGRQHKHAESLVLCQDALIRMRALPKRMRFIHVIKDTFIVKQLLKKYSDADILALPICQDARMTTINDFLTEYTLRSYHCGKKIEWHFATVRKIRISFKYGLSRGSAHAFASFGFYSLEAENNLKEALRMARLARDIMSRIECFSIPTNALALLTNAYFIEAWSVPRESVMETLQKAHHTGMASGNIEMGFQNWALCNIFAQTCGYPLEPIQRTGAELMQQLRIYHVDSVLAMMVETQLAVSCLVGKQEIDWDKLEPTEMFNEKSETYRNVFGYLSRMELGVCFGNYDFATRMSVMIQPHIKHDGSYAGTSKELFYSALAYCGLARQTRYRRHYSRAIKSLKKLRRLCRIRGRNVYHKCLLLEAEVTPVRIENTSKLIEIYDRAIAAANDVGYLQDVALATELAGIAMLDLGEENRGYHYLSQSSELWREYGAHAKVNHLIGLHGRKLDIAGANSSETIADPVFASGDFSEPRKALDLDLLSGKATKMDFHSKSSSSSARDTRKEKADEVSILSDADQQSHSENGASSRSLTWSRQRVEEE
jgi:tetratricopeptide (TPR) repeat protein